VDTSDGSLNRLEPDAEGDVLIGYDSATQEAVLLRDDSRPLGTTIIGRTGYGKTTLFELLIREDIRTATAAIVFDVAVDLSDNLIRFASSDPKLAERVLVVGVDPRAFQRPFGINLYEIPEGGSLDRTVANVFHLLQKVWGEDLEQRPLIAAGVRNTARTIAANPGYTMAEIPLLYTCPALRAKLLSPETLRMRERAAVHQYWRQYDQLRREEDRTQWAWSLINKLDPFPGRHNYSLAADDGRGDDTAAAAAAWRTRRASGGLPRISDARTAGRSALCSGRVPTARSAKATPLR
jgi:hypothetical protein